MTLSRALLPLLLLLSACAEPEPKWQFQRQGHIHDAFVQGHDAAQRLTVRCTPGWELFVDFAHEAAFSANPAYAPTVEVNVGGHATAEAFTAYKDGSTLHVLNESNFESLIQRMRDSQEIRIAATDPGGQTHEARFTLKGFRTQYRKLQHPRNCGKRKTW